jgi:hypothetical protein
MNMHIYEFAKQAGIQHRFEPSNEIWGFDDNLEKFAELIINQCIVLIDERNDIAIEDMWHVDEAMSCAVFDIRDYFELEVNNEQTN